MVMVMGTVNTTAKYKRIGAITITLPLPRRRATLTRRAFRTIIASSPTSALAT
jgi:hypothetical protein